MPLFHKLQFVIVVVVHLVVVVDASVVVVKSVAVALDFVAMGAEAASEAH